MIRREVRLLIVDPFVKSHRLEENRNEQVDFAATLAANYVTEDGGEAIYRSMEFPLTTSVATVQRIMKAELERNRRQREVAFPANLSALRLRPWDSVTLALDRLGPFPARVTGWRLAPDGGVDLTLAEEDPAIWDWDPAVDERATGDSPSVVLPNPGVIAAPATINVETPAGVSFTAMAISWAPVGSAYLSGYELEFRPASVAAWQGYGGALSATAASSPPASRRRSGSAPWPAVARYLAGRRLPFRAASPQQQRLALRVVCVCPGSYRRR